jgi:GNAT superfamily N-acetyltransferase
MRFEPLTREHDRESFDCGSKPLNLFLQQTARQHVERGISRTFVLVDDNATEPPKPVLGYFSLSASEALQSRIPEKFAKRLPAKSGLVRLARLAVDKSRQGRGLGLVLIHEALRKTVESADRIGVCGLIVDAKDESTALFYQHFGFVSVESEPLLLFLPIQTLRKIVEETE